MSNTENACRICLKKIPSNCCTPLDTTRLEKLKLVLPDLKFTPSKEPFICNVCTESLEESYKFKRTCSSSNKLVEFLRNYLEVKDAVNVKELVKGRNGRDENWEKNGQVCRICLKGNEGDYTSFEDAKTGDFSPVSEMCLSILDENLTSDPVICKICMEAFHKTCTFIKQFTTIEEKVKCYHEKFPTEDVEIYKVLEESESVGEEESKSVEEEESESVGEEQAQSCVQEKDEDVSNKEADSRKRSSIEEGSEEPTKKLKLDLSCDTARQAEPHPSIPELDIPSRPSFNELPYFAFTIGSIRASHCMTKNIKDWIKQADAVKSKLNWSDSTAKSKVVEMMKRVPRIQSWFSSIADVTSWEEFLEKVAHTLPDPDDFHRNLIKMVERKKRPSETHEEYFHGKMEVLRPLRFTEEQEVSCLLGGVSDLYRNCLGRIGKYRTRQELLTYLKSCDEKPEKFFKKAMKGSLNAFANKPLLQRNLVVVLENVLPAPGSATEDGPKENEGSADASKQICSCCDRKGHASVNCPLIKSNKAAVAKPEKIRDEKEAKMKESPKVSETVARAKENSAELSEEQQSSLSKSSAKQKCVCCDKFGHSSVDCPLIKSNKSARVEKSNEVQENVTTGKASETVAHGKENNIKVTENQQNSISKPSTKQKCVCCDKIGHSSVDCPLIKSKKTAGVEKMEKVVSLAHNSDKSVAVQDKVSIPSKSATKTKESPKVSETVAPPKENKAGVSGKQQNSESKTSSKQKCVCCDKSGHSSVDCPLIKSNKSAVGKTEKVTSDATHQSNNSRNVTVSSENVTKMKQSSKTSKTVAPPKEKTVGAIEKQQNSTPNLSAKQKCVCCDKLGHSSVDCPLIKGKTGKPVESAPTTKNANIANKKSSIGSDKQGEKCSFCDKFGHSSLVCPLIDCEKKTAREPVRIVLDKNRSAKANRPSTSSSSRSTRDDKKEQSEHSRKTAQTKCSCCDKTGHTSSDCPLVDSWKTTPRQNKIQIILDKDRPDKTQRSNRSSSSSSTPGKDNRAPVKQQNKKEATQSKNTTENQSSRSDKTGNKSLKSPPVAPNKQNAQKTQEKCSVCNKTGHSSRDCASVKVKSNNTVDKVKAPSAENVATPQIKCARCDKFGHFSESCLYSAANKAPETVVPGSKPAHKRKCLCCNNVGHSSLDCPLLGNNKEHLLPQAKVPKYEPSDRPSTGPETCSFCNNSGHTTAACPFYGFFNRNSGTGPSLQNPQAVFGNAQMQPQMARPMQSQMAAPMQPQMTMQMQSQMARPMQSQKAAPMQSQMTMQMQSQMARSMQSQIATPMQSQMAMPMQMQSQMARPMQSQMGTPMQMQPQMARPMQSQMTMQMQSQMGRPMQSQITPELQSQVATQIAMQMAMQMAQAPSQASPAEPTCCFCEKRGHSSIDCFRARFEEKHAQTRAQEHTRSSSSSSSSRQCLYCGKFGHLQADCPKRSRGSSSFQFSRSSRY